MQCVTHSGEVGVCEGVKAAVLGGEAAPATDGAQGLISRVVDAQRGRELGVVPCDRRTGDRVDDGEIAGDRVDDGEIGPPWRPTARLCD